MLGLTPLFVYRGKPQGSLCQDREGTEPLQKETSMTREERYASLYSHDTVYRPPHEEEAALLEVALGCNWGKCLFCDFARDKFLVHPMEKIEENLRILGELEPERERVFLLGENALCLPTENLLKIMDMAKRYLPKVTTFGMYGRFDDVLRKSEEELGKLRAAGLTDVHMGFESGSDSVLLTMNKGVDTADMLRGARLLERADIGYHVTVILGLGGRAGRNLHALETARLLNRMHPKSIWCLNLKVWPKTPLERMVKIGEFEPMSHWEMLHEEWIMLQNLEVKNCLYMDTTALDQFTIQGILPEMKPAMLQAMQQLLEMTAG